MNGKPSICLWVALYLAETARRIVPATHRHWATAMRNELDYLPSDRAALGWAAGCLWASLMQRLRSISVPDTTSIRVLIALPLLILIASDLFATAMTASYRLGFLRVTRVFGQMTPGDDYARLIPLMENVPLWLHALWTSAAGLYVFTLVGLAFRERVGYLPVAAAVILELAARILERPTIASIGLAANPNPSLAATVLPPILPLLVALYLWRMRPSQST